MIPRPSHPSVLAACAFAAALAACASPGGSDTGRPDEPFTYGSGKFDSSVEAVFVDMEFDAEVRVHKGFTAPIESFIDEQLLYTVGQLNGDRSVSRLDKVELTDIEYIDEGDYTRATYHAKIPVAWGDKDNVPADYLLILPWDGTNDGLEAFTEKYKDNCVDWGAHDVDIYSMWYYYRPQRCDIIAKEDVVRTTATFTVSDRNTTGKYPEYDKVWEDDTLRAVVVFGKFESGATTAADPSIASYNRFVEAIVDRFDPAAVTVTPDGGAEDPGIEHPDVQIEVDLGSGKTAIVNVLLVDDVSTALGVESGGAADTAFVKRYEALSGPADLIVYNGHSGLGRNIRALARRGDWQPGQYSVVFMNGCDTYAYVDSALWDARIAVNPDDPTGTKYLDMVMNALPSPANASDRASLALFDGLIAFDAPRTYEEMFVNITSSQVVLVSGEEDNTFQP